MPRRDLISFAIFLILTLNLAIPCFAVEEPQLDLFAPPAALSLTNVTTTDATVAASVTNGRSILHVTTGHKSQWPGITLAAPNGHWDLSPYREVSVAVRNVASNAVTVYCRVDNPGADGKDHCVTGNLKLGPGQSGILHVEMLRLADDKMGGQLFGLRGYPVTRGGPGTVDPANITQLLFFVSQPQENHGFEISEPRAGGTDTPPTAWNSDATPFFPFVDTFGQYRHKDWPGKTTSLADLTTKRTAEMADLVAHPAPPNWDAYGGSGHGPQLSATGFFRTEKVRGKWWLVDPDGRLFFSHGIDCVGYGEKTPITGRTTWFQNFPGRQPEFTRFLSQGHALMGHYAGQSPECFSFGDANLFRKYGPEWPTIASQLAPQRLRSWGMNTIGNWSDRRITALHQTPYTDTLGSGDARMIAGSQGYWGKFPDVFDPSFARGLQHSMSYAAGRSAGDPWCIGYFSDNEMSWGEDTSIALGALKSGSNQPAKQVFIADLRAKYGDIARLNAAWGTNFTSWESLLQTPVTPDAQKARMDLTAFYTKAAEGYFRTVRATVRTAAPHQLYLGCRFAWVNALAAAAAAKYCDVVSYNIYQRDVVNFQFNGGADVPLLIGEFHFGARDRGLFHPGLVKLPNQAARAQAYRDYVTSVLRHPQFVGCHWFQYRDEPILGRVYDEENYQIGFVDVADTPYVETIAAARAIGYHLYD